MGTASIPAVTVSSVEIHSPGATATGLTAQLTVTLTSPIVSAPSTTDWDAQAGLGAFVWGIQVQDDVNATWRLLMQQPAVGHETEYPIGSRGKDGGMPVLRLTSGVLSSFTNPHLRLYASATTPVRVGVHLSWS